MLQVSEAPEKPHFYFNNKCWEIDNEINSNSEGLASYIVFTNTTKTSIVDPDIGFNVKHNALTITDTVHVKIHGEFDDPEIRIFTRNTGTLVGKERDGGEIIQEVSPLSIPLFVVNKLVKEAIKLDAKNRLEQSQGLQEA